MDFKIAVLAGDGIRNRTGNLRTGSRCNDSRL